MAMGEVAAVIVVPLLCCLLAIPLGRHAPRLMWAAAPVNLVLAFAAARRVHGGTILRETPGGWPAPLGIELRIDGLAAAFLCLSAVAASGIGLFAIRYFQAAAERESFAFWPLFFAAWTAINAIFVSQDLFNLYVALELLTLAAVAMVALEGKGGNIIAAVRYLLYALFGSLAFLGGVALLYATHGMLDLRLLGAAMAPDAASIAAAALMTAGLFAKAAIFPLHAWLPPAHGGAPAPASALLSALVVKAVFYILFRLWFDMFPILAGQELLLLFGGLGTAAMIFGSAQALRQRRLKLIIAYSTIAQLGYLLLVFPLAGGDNAIQPWTASAWTGASLHALAHGLSKAAMFLAAGAMMLVAGDDRVDNLAGLGRAAPMACFAFGLAAVSLMGLPPSGGFLAKYLMLTAAFAGGEWWWGVVLVIGGLLSAAYLFRPLAALMMPRPDGAPPLAPASRALQLPPLLLAISAILLGIVGGPYQLLQAGGPLAAEVGLQ